MARTYLLEQTQFVPRPRAEVFAFFSDAANLERLTPGFLRFQILTPSVGPMQPGALIEYQLSLYGVPVRWKTLIETFSPEDSFSDVQLVGPYQRWHHLHQFREVPGGTEMHDTVDYQLPLGPLGSLARALFVRRSLEQIFAYRRKVVAELFGAA